MNIKIISLKRAQDRRKNMISQMNNLGLKYDIFDAIDGNELTPEESKKYICLPGGYREGELFKPGEIGCTMSHIKSLKKAQNENLSYVIVLEDDVVLAKDFKKRIKLLLRILPSHWEHVYLSGIPLNDIEATKLIIPNVVPSVFTQCTHSMMFKNTVYDKVIKKLSKFETTTDDIIADMILNKKLISYTYYPFVTYANDEYTYIWNKKLSRIHSSKKYFKENIL